VDGVSVRASSKSGGDVRDRHCFDKTLNV
jgi:hypothetical protein